MLAMTFFVSCEEEETIQAVIDEAELSLSTETVNLTEAAGDEATVEITSDQTVFDVNVDYAYKNWLEAELEGTTITVRTTQTNPTTEARTGVVSVVAGENGITATAYISVVQAANSSIPVLELSTDRVSLPQDASESVTVDVNTNQTISLSVDADAQSWCSAAYADGKITITARSAYEGNYAPTPATLTIESVPYDVKTCYTDQPTADNLSGQQSGRQKEAQHPVHFVFSFLCSSSLSAYHK